MNQSQRRAEGCSVPCEPGTQHCPPLPVIAVGRRAYSPTYRRHGTIKEIGKVYATLSLDRDRSGWTVMVQTAELVPVE